MLDRHRLAWIRLRRDYHALNPGGDLDENERARRLARQVQLSRRLIDELLRIENDTPLMVEVRAPMEYPTHSYGTPSYSSVPPGGPAGDLWRSVTHALSSVLDDGAVGYVHTEWTHGVLCAGLAVTETVDSTERVAEAAIASVTAEAVDGMTVARNGSIVWPST